MNKNNINKNEASIPHQSRPHAEGQQSNVAPAGHPNTSDNNTVSGSEMMQDAPEQIAGRKNHPQPERDRASRKESDRRGNDSSL